MNRQTLRPLTILALASLAPSGAAFAGTPAPTSPAWLPVPVTSPLWPAPIRSAVIFDLDGAGPNAPVLVLAGGAATTGLTVWNGTSFSAFPSTNFSGTVTDLAVVNGELIAGGSFTTNNAVTLNRIARWNGTAWEALGSGFASGSVNAIGEHNGQLIAGGSFTASGTTTVNRIAVWDGTAWQSLGTGAGIGLGGTVEAVASFGGELIAGGSFSTAGGNPALLVARWDGTSWQPFGESLPTQPAGSVVNAMVNYNGSLVVGGGFVGPTATPPAQTPINLALWTGASWQVLGDSFNPRINGMTEHNGAFFAGGTFNSLLSAPGTLRVAKFVGSWQAMGFGNAGNLNGVIGYGDELITFGQQTGANTSVTPEGSVLTMPSRFFSRWREGVTVEIIDQPDNANAACGAAAVFTAKPAAGYAGLAWRWSKNGIPLSNGPLAGSGATVAITASGIDSTLTITGADSNAAGTYTATLVTVGGEVVSQAATLVVSCPCTPSDVAGPNQSIGADGQLTADDIIVFLGWFFVGDVRADVAGLNQSTIPDGEFNADDIIVFLNRYFAGC